MNSGVLNWQYERVGPDLRVLIGKLRSNWRVETDSGGQETIPQSRVHKHEETKYKEVILVGTTKETKGIYNLIFSKCISMKKLSVERSTTWNIYYNVNIIFL